MDAGAYRHLITIQKCVVSRDEIGNPTEEWKEYRTAYAYVNGVSGKEYWEAATVQQENTVEFTFRWYPFFDEMDTKQYRLIFKNRVFNINLIDNVQYRNETVKIKAVASSGEQ